MEAQQSDIPVDEQDVEGLDTQDGSWGDYPIDALLIRHETRTVFDVIRRIDKGRYVMDPDFQRDFIWPEDKQSKLIESVLMRIPLPVFYLAEDREGRMIVVDGLQTAGDIQELHIRRTETTPPGPRRPEWQKVHRPGTQIPESHRRLQSYFLHHRLQSAGPRAPGYL